MQPLVSPLGEGPCWSPPSRTQHLGRKSWDGAPRAAARPFPGGEEAFGLRTSPAADGGWNGPCTTREALARSSRLHQLAPKRGGAVAWPFQTVGVVDTMERETPVSAGGEPVAGLTGRRSEFKAKIRPAARSLPTT